jgi:inner membrane protein
MNLETTTQRIWSGSKLMIKTIVIGLIILILQIPTAYVESLIKEREQRQNDAINEVSSKWAGKQDITGPIIILPYWDNYDSVAKTKQKHYAYFLPDELNIKSSVMPMEKYRGIYKVMLYTSDINLTASFSSINVDKLLIDPGNVIWNEAFVKFIITDTKGLNEELKLKYNDEWLVFSPQASESKSSADGLVAPLHISKQDDLKSISFSGNISMNGSQELLFTPIGKSTSVSINSKWPHPSFTGNSLPQTTSINDNGFTASWKSLAHKRAYPQQWKDDAYFIGNTISNSNAYTNQAASPNNITTSSFGTDLFIPVNAYQKTTRSVKYALLCILLTFAAFFLIETTNKKSIHPFQYGLIGIALVLFYTLLLSFSEYIGFNLSYLVASVATIILIAWFVKGILAETKLTLLLAVILTLIYSYIFTILQLQDYSLLLGSVGLFITLAIIMHYSKKIHWSPAAN